LLTNKILDLFFNILYLATSNDIILIEKIMNENKT
jgi:hypothetical protein